MQPPVSTTSLSFKRVKPAIWYAFISHEPALRRLIHRQNGAVWLLPDEPPGGLQLWAEVDVISQDEQRRWAREVAGKLGLGADPEINQAIAAQNWYREFPDRLKLKHPNGASDWNRLRSQRVQIHIEGWCDRSKVGPAMLFEEYRTSQGAAVRPRSAVTLRETLVAALGRMTTHELLTLTIPVKHVIAVLRPDLLDHGDLDD